MCVPVEIDFFSSPLVLHMVVLLSPLLKILCCMQTQTLWVGAGGSCIMHSIMNDDAVLELETVVGPISVPLPKARTPICLQKEGRLN